MMKRLCRLMLLLVLVGYSAGSEEAPQGAAVSNLNWGYYMTNSPLFRESINQLNKEGWNLDLARKPEVHIFGNLFLATLIPARAKAGQTTGLGLLVILVNAPGSNYPPIVQVVR